MQGESPADRIRAGPVYTSAQPADGTPKFPDLQVLMDLPLSAAGGAASPSSFRMRADGGKFYPATRVQTMAASGHAMAVAVILDMSGSMKGGPLPAIRKGLGRFAGDAGPRDRIAIETIADDSRWDVNWGDSREQIRGAIENLRSRGKLTRLWDGLLDAIGRLPAIPTARRMIVISDGHDEGSAHLLEQVIATYQQQLVPIDAIGITRSNPVYLANLQRLADGTGGQFHDAGSEADLERLVGGGIERLRSMPVVSFRLNDLSADGTTHEFEFFWKHDGAESTSRVRVKVPVSGTVPFTSRRRFWLWLAGVPAIVLAVAGIAMALRRSPGKLAPVAVQTPEPLPVERPSPAAIQPAGKPAPARFTGVASRAYPQPPSHSAKPAAATASPAQSRTQFTVSFPEPSSARPAAWLFGEEGFGAGQWFPVDTREYWIGGNENNHLQITSDPTVSGNHGCIVFETGTLGIFDYGSTNGTRVNNDVVQDYRRLLQPGDRIRIGQSTFVVHARHEPEIPQ
jgi:Mg-chelatase subunit ChlD